jgi:PAS domain S-box-containing protein
LLRGFVKHPSVLLFLTPVLLLSSSVLLAQTPALAQSENLPFWSHYKWYVIIALATFVVQAFLIARLLFMQARRRQAEIESRRLAALAEAERKRVNDIVSNVPGAVWETRIDPVTHERTTTFISDYIEKMLGYTVEEWKATPSFALTLIHPDDRERVLREAEAVFASDQPTFFQFRWIAKDGHTVWAEANVAPLVDEAGTTIGVRGVTLDITQQHEAEVARRQSEELFRNMADTAPVMIWLTGMDRQCIYINKQWLDFTGRTIEEQLGNGWVDAIHPDDREGAYQTYARAFDERTTFGMEYRLRRHDGEYRWIFDTGAPRVSPDNVFVGYIGSCIDITERKESEVELHEAHEELKRLKNQLEAENVYLQQELQLDPTFGEIVGQSDGIKYVLFKVTQVAPTNTTVLITGETGTGKELVARAIHISSSRKNRAFIKVNCGALAPSLIESELFGHEKGAFTGASARKLGRFELANGGTIFLDEIGELPLELQVKLLRVIQENEFERLGGTKTIKADVRIIAATNRNLKVEVENGKFREDLWYRLNVYPITVPPLRQRKEDIPLLVEHFVNGYAKKFGKTITSVSPRALQTFQNHSWPGNVRELANAIERAVIHAKGSVLHSIDRFEEVSEEPLFAAKTLEEIEREHIIRTLENTGWRIEGPHGAANILGLNPSTLRTRMVKLGIQRARYA